MDQEKKHSMVYWFCINSWNAIRTFGRKHKITFILLLLVISSLLFIGRPYLHEYIIYARRYSYAPILGINLLGLVFLASLGRHILTRIMAFIFMFGLVGYFIYSPINPYEYVAYYYRYKTLEKKELEEFPTTAFERIQPLHSILVRAKRKMGDSYHPATPALVRENESYKWTIGVEPEYLFQQVKGGVRQVYSVSATSPAPNFSPENTFSVNFYCGEKSKFGRNIRINIIKRFGLWQYFNFEPGEVRYVRNDKGEFVQIISVIRWRGFIFPRPEFGGVYVIKQYTEVDEIKKHINSWRGYFKNNLKMWLYTLEQIAFGVGDWVSVNEITNHKFLQKQNIYPDSVARFIANSFRFQTGFFAPFPGYHKGDIRISDLAGDRNNQPFTVYFLFTNSAGESKLYKYFSLEPYHPGRMGLNTSLLIPADGQGPTNFYRHTSRGEALIGVSAVANIIRADKMHYNWGKTVEPAENRPVVIVTGGIRRFFWFTTVVSFEEGHEDEFYAGSIPKVVLTDAAYEVPVWVDPKDPSSWPGALEKKLQTIWDKKS